MVTLSVVTQVTNYQWQWQTSRSYSCDLSGRHSAAAVSRLTPTVYLRTEIVRRTVIVDQYDSHYRRRQRCETFCTKIAPWKLCFTRHNDDVFAVLRCNSASFRRSHCRPQVTPPAGMAGNLSDHW